jgi:ferredoxin
VQLINPREKTDKTIEVDEFKTILDVAEEKGIPLPYSCRAGACSTCVAKVISGTVDQSEQVYLSQEQVRKTPFLLFVAFFLFLLS